MSKFQDLINSDTPLLVDFHATWCGPCKTMAPVLQQLAADIGTKGKIIKVDVDKNSDAARAYQVNGVPTFILFRNGKQIWRQSGVVPLAELKAQFEKAVASTAL